jgi:DNA-binding GntR family transcriptional regulator
MALRTVERTASSATRDNVYLELRGAIVSATLAPGAQLSENALAGEMSVSRTPVREALAMLRDERLVAVVPQLGTFVTRIAPSAVADAAFVREALECSAVRLAAERITASALEALQANLAAQDDAVRRGDTQAFDALDNDLHRLLCEAAGHAIAWSLARRANGQLDRVRGLSLPEPGYLAEMVLEHRAVVAAVASGDASGAEEALRRHLRMVLSLLPAIRQKHPDYFDEQDVT